MSAKKYGIINSLIKRTFRVKQLVKFGNYTLEFPYNNPIPGFLNKYEKFNRFLPRLIKLFRNNTSVIDVGANVGDTVGSLVCENDNLKYYCIEPYEKYRVFLRSNVRKITEKHPKCSIKILEHLIGNHRNPVCLEGPSGSKSAVESASGNYIPITLDQVCLNISDISLIKIDIDGNDYQVIDSGTMTIKKHKPVIFFECLLTSATKVKNYIKTIEILDEISYNYWAVFDNFGELIFTGETTDQLKQFVKYVYAQNSRGIKRTIEYFDIACCCEYDKSILHRAILNHQNDYSKDEKL